MPHLWYISHDEWVAERLAAARILAPWSGDESVLIRIRAASGNDSGYALLAVTRALRVNGDPVPTGLRVLRDRDEILCPGGCRLYFSTEDIAEVVPYPGVDIGDSAAPAGGARCPRCRCDIERGSDAVACPRCRTFYHCTQARPCYAYHEQCCVCSGPTTSVAEPAFGWTPCEL